MFFYFKPCEIAKFRFQSFQIVLISSGSSFVTSDEENKLKHDASEKKLDIQHIFIIINTYL